MLVTFRYYTNYKLLEYIRINTNISYKELM